MQILGTIYHTSYKDFGLPFDLQFIVKLIQIFVTCVPLVTFLYVFSLSDKGGGPKLKEDAETQKMSLVHPEGSTSLAFPYVHVHVCVCLTLRTRVRFVLRLHVKEHTTTLRPCSTLVSLRRPKMEKCVPFVSRSNLITLDKK